MSTPSAASTTTASSVDTIILDNAQVDVDAKSKKTRNPSRYVTKQLKLNIQVPRVAKLIRSHLTKKVNQLGGDAAPALACIGEYLMWDLYRSAGSVAKLKNRTIIKATHVADVLNEDEEFAILKGDSVVAYGGCHQAHSCTFDRRNDVQIRKRKTTKKTTAAKDVVSKKKSVKAAATPSKKKEKDDDVVATKSAKKASSGSEKKSTKKQ